MTKTIYNDGDRRGLYRMLNVEPDLKAKIDWLVANEIGTREEYEADSTAAHYDYEVNTL